MKRAILFVSATVVVLSLFTMLSCNKNKTRDLQYGITENEPNLVNEAMRLNGKLLSGAFPGSTGNKITTDNPYIISYPAAVEVSAGVEVYIPYSTNNNSDIRKLYVQVQGASKYWEIPINTSQNNGLSLKVFIPNIVVKGSYNLVYAVENTLGLISPIATTNTIVADPVKCGATSEGSVGITVKHIDLGNTAGIISLTYDTYTIPDRIDVLYNGAWVASTGVIDADYIPSCNGYPSTGFVSGQGAFKFKYNPANGPRSISVYITGCDNDTKWTLTVNCPEKLDDNWRSKLPACPCNYDDIADGQREDSGTWGKCGLIDQSLDVFHYGATYEIRWFPDNKDFVPGQQCNYSADKKLITSGIAAGSPDLVSPKSCSLSYTGAFGHFPNDVYTWYSRSCVEYLDEWRANNAKACLLNPVSDITHMLKLVGTLSCKRVTYLFEAVDSSTVASTELKNYFHGKLNYTPTTLKDQLSQVRDEFLYRNPLYYLALSEAVDNLSK